MEQKTLYILIAADDSTQWEAPVGFDYNAAMSRVRRLKPEVEKIVGRPFEIDEQVQDASFFADLSLCKAGAKSGHIDTVLALRFSAFGNLFTTWNHCSTEQITPKTIEQIIELAENLGFTYVSTDDLKQTYSGAHEGFRSAPWWIRFFDYV